MRSGHSTRQGLDRSSLGCKRKGMSTDTPASESDSPQQLLAAAQQYSRQARLAQRQTWFPLLVLGLVVAGWPLVGLSGPPGGGCGPVVRTATSVFRYCTVAGSRSFFWYWMVSLSVAYILITWFYLWRARRRGVGTRVGRYAWAWLGGLALIGASVWAVHAHLNSLTPGDNSLGFRLAAFTPLLAIAAGLFALAWVERHPALAWFTVGYLALAAVVLVSTWPSLELSHLVGHHPVLFAASRYLAVGGVLLLGSARVARVERSQP
jgi:hypothetical protein